MIRIKGMKTVNGNIERCIKVEEIEALERNDLPKVYLKGVPRCFKNMQGIVIIDENGRTICFNIGDTLTKSEIDRICETLRKCGQRLRKINCGIKTLEEEWNGKVKIEI